MDEQIKQFAESFRDFIKKNDYPEEAIITLSKWQDNWMLSYKDKEDNVKEEFATLLFLSQTSFYQPLKGLLAQMEKKMDCEDFSLTVFLSEKNKPYWRVDAIENTLQAYPEL